MLDASADRPTGVGLSTLKDFGLRFVREVRELHQLRDARLGESLLPSEICPLQTGLQIRLPGVDASERLQERCAQLLLEPLDASLLPRVGFRVLEGQPIDDAMRAVGALLNRS